MTSEQQIFNALLDSFTPTNSTPGASPQQYERPSGRSIKMTETVKFEIDYDNLDNVEQTRKHIGLDGRYPIGPAGRPVAGSKRTAKAIDKTYGAPMKAQLSKGRSDENSGQQAKIPWAVQPPESFSFGTLTGDGGAGVQDIIMFHE